MIHFLNYETYLIIFQNYKKRCVKCWFMLKDSKHKCNNSKLYYKICYIYMIKYFNDINVIECLNDKSFLDIKLKEIFFKYYKIFEIFILNNSIDK